MSHHTAKLHWKINEGDFATNRYSRAHTWTFDGGLTVPASPSPSVVPAPWSDESAIDPEEAFVASVSSCHLLWFLHLARVKGYLIESYEDDAIGTLAKNNLTATPSMRCTMRHTTPVSSPTPCAAKSYARHVSRQRSAML